MFKIVHREELGKGTIILNEIMAPRIAKKARPGQFVILKATENGERIPLTMADTNPEQGTITIVYMIIGRSTATFGRLKEGDSFMDIIGPLGRPTRLEKVGRAVCVGGGTGVAVLHPITRALKEIGNDVTAITGARNRELIILEEWMKKASNRLYLCTDDGSYGHHGFVTDILGEIIATEEIGLVVAIGPVPMMKAVAELTRPHGIHTLASLNPIMVDGTGMCGCCRVTVGGEMKFGCVDGPEFDAHKVDFDELMLRLRSYTDIERQSFDDFNAAQHEEEESHA